MDLEELRMRIWKICEELRGEALARPEFSAALSACADALENQGARLSNILEEISR